MRDRSDKYGFRGFECKLEDIPHIPNSSDNSVFSPLTVFRFINNFMLIENTKTNFVRLGLTPVMSFNDPSLIACEVDNTVLGRKIIPGPQIVRQTANDDRFLLCYVAKSEPTSFKTLAAFIYKALHCDPTLLGFTITRTITMSQPFSAIDVKLGKLFTSQCVYWPLITTDYETLPSQFVKAVTKSTLDRFLSQLGMSKYPLFFVLKIAEPSQSLPSNEFWRFNRCFRFWIRIHSGFISVFAGYLYLINILLYS
uniref:Uncharacterized protein n=1 Tax=Phanerochaete carnosa TaxID=231932 RepID=A0A895KWY9_9APHY|nr:hypothetical protein K8K84_mgp051 [Phanerochaete carnosa]QRZ60401.1 hypothetical protein [Phanerochaete carnosa]